MSNKSNEDRLRTLVEDQLAVPGGQITPDMSFADDLGADCLDQIELAMSIEEAFGIEVPDELWDQITTFGEALELIEQAA